MSNDLELPDEDVARLTRQERALRVEALVAYSNRVVDAAIKEHITEVVVS